MKDVQYFLCYRVAPETETLISAQSQKVMDDIYQRSRVIKSPKLNEVNRAMDLSLLSADEKSVSPSSGRLRTSARNEVTLNMSTTDSVLSCHLLQPDPKIRPGGGGNSRFSGWQRKTLILLCGDTTPRSGWPLFNFLTFFLQKIQCEWHSLILLMCRYSLKHSLTVVLACSLC